MRRSRASYVSPHLFLLASLVVTRFLPVAGFKNIQTKASNMAKCLHRGFEDNIGLKHIQRQYDSLHCVKEDIDMKTLIGSIVKPAATRLRASAAVLRQYNGIRTENTPSGDMRVNIADDCCQRTSAWFSERFHSNVSFSSGCGITQRNQSQTGEADLDNELVKGFKRNLNRSSDVVWQYYGSIDGKYLQYPASTRYCNGPTSQYDPRFKSWYVETASPMKKNLVIIIDRSGSMWGLRMNLAIEAALTVLDTVSPEDNVGILAFSNVIETPSGCFGTTVAKGTPANLKKLREWVRDLRARGSTWYGPAFRHAFSMFRNATDNQTSERSNIILFLTDGNPSDTKESDIFQAIEEGRYQMNQSVQINTYALGMGLSDASLQRLKTIAYNNSGVFREIRDLQGGQLKLVMGSYYTSVKTPIRTEPRIFVPRRDPNLGLMVTMSLTLTSNGSFKGVVAQDLLLERVFKETLHVESLGPLIYAILVDKEGRTILHPSLPTSTNDQTFLPLSLMEPQLPTEVISNITSRGSGIGRFQTVFPLPRGGHSTDGTRMYQTSAIYIWSPVESSMYTVVLVVVEGKHVGTNLTSYGPSSEGVTSRYHRLDLTWNTKAYHPRDTCNLSGQLVSPSSSTVKIAPTAFSDTDSYIHTSETLEDVQLIEQFFNDNSSSDFNGLSTEVRAEVLLTSELEAIWKMAERWNPGAVQWRFIGTENGVLRMYPGLRLHKTFTHKQETWYKQAISSPSTLVLSSTASIYQQNKVFSLSKTVLKTSSSCRISSSTNSVADVMAVIGMDMTESSLMQLIDEDIGFNNENDTHWYLLGNDGYIMLNLSSSRLSQLDEQYHLTEVFPWLASVLIQHRALQGLWCNDYDQHTVEFFYDLSVGPEGASSNSTEPCRQFAIHPVSGTSLYLLGLPSRKMHYCSESPPAPDEGCYCERSCNVCSTSVASSCQCPCSCSMSYDECENSVKRQWTATPCPVAGPPPYDTEREEFALKRALQRVPPCPSDCRKILNASECAQTMGCHWCSLNVIPSCSSECRMNQSLSVVILFPCNNFMNLSEPNRKQVKYLIKRVLIRQLITLTPLNLGTIQLQQEGALLQLYATTTNKDLRLVKDEIQTLIEEGKLFFGPTARLHEAYTAKSADEYTDLIVKLGLEPSLPYLSKEVKQEAWTQLQSFLVSLLGDSYLSIIRQFHIAKTSLEFSLSNEGRSNLYPIQRLDTVLRKAVLDGRLSLTLSPVGEDVPLKITVSNMSSYWTFDFLCHSATPTLVVKSTRSVSSTGSTTGRRPPAAPSQSDSGREPGLTPVEIGILTTAAVVVLSMCPCILLVVLTRRRRNTRRKKVSPEDEPEGELPSDISQLSVLEPDVERFMDKAYSPPPTRIPLSPREAWAKAKLLTVSTPKNVPEGAWF